ncbi:TBC1 domain family member 22B [Sarcoptes scabiei]|uniref:TBC1 domain family member 22B n=2 Tax=Sarcoptes scabiei TaxID=52283 RepID=A0A834R5I0_SARSC|nr:TBC1 domain family member 22B [Sarcoptes scabiei]
MANSNSNSTILKFPGLARPSSIDSERRNRSSHPKPTGSSSSLSTLASCDDAWNDKIEDKISYPNIEKTQHIISNNLLKFGNNKSSILIKEIQSFDQQQLPSTNTSLSGSPMIKKNNATEKSNNLPNFNQPVKAEDPKLAKLKKLLYEDDTTDLNLLRTITWSGIADEDRPLAWKLLLGYIPAVQSKRAAVSENKKSEYQNLVAQYFHNRQENDEIYRQIHIDIPRMQPLISIFQQPIVQGIFERILYIWSIRHPASGYVQGMNDLVTPFFVTYLSEFVPGHSFSNVEAFDVSTLPNETIAMIESDSYWSFNKLLDSIQDNYTFAQPGIQRLIILLARVVSRVDKKLHEHLENNSVQYLQFAFRWMNNLLIREIPLRCIIRLWDTYLSEGTLTSTYVPSTNFNDPLEFNSWSMNSGTPFSSAFHLFVCAAFLRFWSKSLLQETDFQGLMLRLQNLPTFHWSENEVKLLVADAYQLKYAFSPNHLKV